MKEVKKAWGKEVIIVNEEYCAKLLHIAESASSSIHYHKTKKETFLCLLGWVTLNVDGILYSLMPNSEPVTIPPETPHSFYGKKKSILLEVSTHHEDDDVVRSTESKGAE